MMSWREHSKLSKCFTSYISDWMTVELRPMGAQTENMVGVCMSNGCTTKGHSDDIVGIAELIVKRLYRERFTVPP